ncbi:hypothetical protein CARUB_v10024498mg [Capsella rubella]|uniref:Helicase C-terminal domain-containing protein n=1 Tax=Capsella rubella TaxID=81985 RepID=R0HSF2_9BRAS|nr:hypothetical protein CARUB_v10024498mg [Capsella rubella]
MDSKRKLSEEKDIYQNIDGKRKKLVTLENQEAGGTSNHGLVDVPIMYLTSEKDTIGSSFTHLMIGGSSSGGNTGQGDTNIFLDGNELVETEIFDLNETVWPKDKPVSDTFETSGEIPKNCEHSWIWKQGSGHVCWICGIIDEDHPLPPGFGSNNCKDISLRVPKDGFLGSGIFPHPSHRSSMSSHHIEILNFLCKNLGVEDSNGCIVAQAPISEKTFLMINFVYGYLKKYPNSKPLFVLPKGMSEVLQQWVLNRGILFLGAKQFASIVDDNSSTEAALFCKDTLIKTPSLVIFDKGTDPRNEMMRFLKSIARIKTPNKILLIGTLYQNKMKEVFNVLDVAFPERYLNVDAATDGLSLDLKMPLFDELEDALLHQDTDHGDKICYLTELRMLTNKVIYNHQGEFRLEVPGMMDFTVVLKPTSSQKLAWDIERNIKRKGFKTHSILTGITLHPVLSTFSDRVRGLPAPNVDQIDDIIKDIDGTEGVKTKFFLGLVKLCDHTNEKILVVSQYVIPLIFLQTLVAKIKGWKDGKETFMIKGDTSNSDREVSINQFNNSHEARIFFASIKACNEQINLTGATRILMLDIIANPCMARQAIEMAYHPGQQNKVYSYRLVAADTSEEDEDIMAARKEIISGIWFDGKTYPVDGQFCIPNIDGNYSDDYFLGASYMKEDIKTIYKRFAFLKINYVFKNV